MMIRSKLGLGLIAITCISLSYYAVQFGISSLYKIGLDNEFEIYNQYVAETVGSNDQAVAEKKYELLEHVNYLTDEMLAWDSYAPDNLSAAAYTELLNSYSDQNVDIYDGFVTQSLWLNRDAIAVRPVFPDVYAQQAYAINGVGGDMAGILKRVRLAERFGPYEKITALTGIDFYFSFWDQLKTEDKVKATNYVLNPRTYGLQNRQRDDLIVDAPYKERVCSLMAFTGSEPRVCRK